MSSIGSAGRLCGYLKLSACASALAATFCMPAMAQERGAEAGTESPGTEIVVTAQKREQALSDVPVSVTALTGEQLIDKGINSVQDLAKVTPGLSVSDSAGRGGPVFTLRGIGFYDTALGARPTVSVYIDEAPIPFSVQSQAAAFDLERVEVLKGPQGTLFGQSSTGGAINYVAAKPTSTFHAGVSASYGRFNRADVQAHVSGPLTPTLNARLAVHTQQGGDWQESYTRNDSIGRQNFTQGRLMLDWKPTDRLSVLLNANGFYDGSDNQAGAFLSLRRIRPQFPLLNNYPLPPAKSNRAADFDAGQDFRRHNKYYQGVARINYELTPNLDLTSLTSYSHEDVDSYVDGDGTALQHFSYINTGRLETISQELRLSGEAGPMHYIVGANYEHDEVDEIVRTLVTYSSFAPITGADTGARSGQRFNTIATFVDGTLQASDQIRLTGGLRYTRQDLDYRGCLTFFDQASATTYTNYINTTIRGPVGLPPIAKLAPLQCGSLDPARNPAEAVGNLTEDNISWRAVADFKPSPGTLLYASVSKGFKAGSISTPGASSTEQFRPVTQESVLAYEAGIKTSLLDRKVDVTAAAFYYDYKDKQLLGRNVFKPDIFGPQSALVNIPKTRIVGAEAQITVRPVVGMTLSAFGTYVDSKVQGDFVNYDLIGNQANFANSAFPYTPKWQIGFEGEERVPVSESLFGVLRWNASYRTKTIAGFGTDPRLAIDSYWLLDLQAGVESADRRWKVGVYGRNILNQYYWHNVAFAGEVMRRLTGMPATYGVTASFRY